METNIIQNLIDKVKPILPLTEKEEKILTTPEHVRKAQLTVNSKQYPAYRVQFNSARGPYKGGIRYHPEVTEEEVTEFSFLMTLKTATTDLPLGGGKGGVAVNPHGLTQEELKELSEEYVKAFYEHMGPNKDVPAPDMYTNSQIMAWMLDEYEKQTNTKAPGFITGKPLDKGGSLVRDIATALGGFYVLQEAIKKLQVQERTVAIQGFGNAGRIIAKFLVENGFKVIAVSDSSGGIYNEEGLNIQEVMRVKDETRKVSDYEFATKISNEELLQLECAVLVPAALTYVINKDNAANIKAKIVLELANGPTTPQADEILHKNNVLVLPDILANAGGVTVSCFEWQQNLANEKWTEDDIKAKLKSKMVAAFDGIWDEYNKHKADFRTITYVIAIKRVLEAERQRGNLQ